MNKGFEVVERPVVERSWAALRKALVATQESGQAVSINLSEVKLKVNTMSSTFSRWAREANCSSRIQRLSDDRVVAWFVKKT